MPSQLLIDDGIIVWFDGPGWDDVAKAAFEDAASDIENEAKANAPWEDQTGMARAGLTAKVENDNGEIVLTLFHTVEYGLWLEVIQSGRFATIMPTLERYAPRVLQQASEAVSAARRGND